MSKYSIELRQLIDDPFFEIFDFNYQFYTDDETIRKSFEEKFKDHYYFCEIGCETVARWKHMLRSRLNMKARYYQQLYQTELESQGISFLLNKDLREEFTRTIETERNENSSSSTNSNSSSTAQNDSKVSNIENGVSSVSLSNNYLTGVSRDTSSANNTNSSKLSANRSGVDNQTEKTVLVSQGNIGTTSSAELLDRWRDVLINIDEMIIDELKDLFMLVY